MRGWMGKAALLLLASCCIGFSHAQLSPLPKTTQGEESYLPDPDAAKLTSLGFDVLLSDFYWLQAVQIAGGEKGPYGQSHRIGALIDLVTALNPKVSHPYRFAALWMTDDLNAVRTANRLLERGIEAHPEDWRQRFYLAFNHFFYLGENERAAEVLTPAIHLEGAPAYLGGLAARLRSDREGLDAAEAFLTGLLKGAEDDRTYQMYEWALKEIKTERHARILDQAREVFRERQGRDIESIDELVHTAPPVLRLLPPEPFGEGWKINEDGVIVSAKLRHRYVPKIDGTSRGIINKMKKNTAEETSP